MMLTGMMVSPEVLSTRNMIMALLAVSFLSFSDCSSCMAFRPQGVAALSSPSMLADTFMKMLPKAGCPLGMSGKSFVSRGLRKRARRETSPLSSPTLRMPIHRVSVPVSPRVRSKAYFDISKVESIMAGSDCVSPMKTRRHTPTAMPMRKRLSQM